MLRITLQSESAKEAVLQVDGWLVGASVGILEQEGRHHLEEGKSLALDLKGIKFIDEDGIELLQRWSRDRLVLHGGSPFVRLLLAEHGLG